MGGDLRGPGPCFLDAIISSMAGEGASPMAKEQPRDGAAPALVVSHLTKRFGDRSAFEDVSFAVARGEVFGFLGPNGAGKTTTVRTLGTLIAPTSGSAVVAGVPLSAATGAEIRQLISVMPENPGLYLRLTVEENLELFAGLYGLHHPELKICCHPDAHTSRTISGVKFRPVAMRAASRVVSSTSRKYTSAACSTIRAAFAWSAGRTFVCHCSRIAAKLPPKVSSVSWI